MVIQNIALYLLAGLLLTSLFKSKLIGGEEDLESYLNGEEGKDLSHLRREVVLVIFYAIFVVFWFLPLLYIVCHILSKLLDLIKPQ